jgi:hypothetical protein
VRWTVRLGVGHAAHLFANILVYLFEYVIRSDTLVE